MRLCSPFKTKLKILDIENNLNEQSKGSSRMR